MFLFIVIFGGYMPFSPALSRREMIRLSFATLLSLFPLASISCGKRLTSVDTDIDPDIYHYKTASRYCKKTAWKDGCF